MANILIVVGAIIFLLGIIGLIKIALEPIEKAFGVVFKRKDDFVFYESKEGKELLDREVKILTTASLVFMFLGLLMFGTGMFMKYASHGPNSFFHVEGEDMTDDDSTITNPHASGKTSNGHYIGANGNEYVYYISITGNTIDYNGNLFNSVEEFENYIKGSDKGYTIYLNDDFAVAKTYHEVESILEAGGFMYDTEEEQQ